MLKRWTSTFTLKRQLVFEIKKARKEKRDDFQWSTLDQISSGEKTFEWH